MEFAIKNQISGLYESFEFSDVNVIQTISSTTINLIAKLEDNEFSKYTTIKSGNIVTKIDIPNIVTMKLTSRLPFTYTIPNHSHVYYNKTKVKDFLYEIDYGNIDYDYAKDFFSSQMIDSVEGLCSSVRNGRFYGRNLDWLYDNNVDFVVHTPKSENRYAVLGVAGNAPDITSDKVDQDVIDHNGYDMFKVLPFFMLDGINEKGVFINVNVAPLNNVEPIEGVYEIKASVEEKERLCSKMIPRFVLDNFSSAKSAIEYIQKYVTVYFPSSMVSINYQVHFMIGDNASTYVMEFVDGKTVYTKSTKMTNFHITNVNFNKDGKVYTPADVEFDETKKPSIKNNIEKYGAGLERWNVIVDKYAKANTKKGMRDLLESVYYSHTYTNTENLFHSEFAHEKNNLWIEDGMPESDDPKYITTVDSKPSEYDKVENYSREQFKTKERGVTSAWITVHSSLYDLQSKTLYLKTQEEDEEYKFNLN